MRMARVIIVVVGLDGVSVEREELSQACYGPG